MSPPMLLMRNLTQFLGQNTSATVPTLMLLAPTGKLLASASPMPASQLRTQATLAYSLWTLYRPSVSSIVAALPPATAASLAPASQLVSSPSGASAPPGISTITVQLDQGVMVIRALTCGLYFVAVGSSPTAPLADITPDPPSENNAGPASSIDANSLVSSDCNASSIFRTKKMVEEIGEWLDRKLDGFALYAGEGR
ncbi:Bgt-4716 [Blumeria graminis f. sp. tritici]|uniref:Bgt-4716 n=2 Tax=Blumeria graminis f. sp. tritici TaxID=62690 RepID=A0A9X9MGT4_BLUGR|nr:hypothetical protein BGT96224_4716 [Blumeria graminis f. sp. tritici 96224]VDB86293.1 Bgt-4716 [Blumeria graminis f. sp. tritici]